MTELELRNLSDQDLNAWIRSFKPKIDERDAKGGVTSEAAKALSDSLPFHREADRRQKLAERAQRNSELAELDKERAERKEQSARMRRILNGEVL